MSDQIEILTKDELKEIDEPKDELAEFDPEKELNPRQRLFVEYYMLGDKETRWNAKASYMKAYDNDNDNASGVGGAKLLMSPKIKKYQRLINVASGLNHEAVDNRLKQLIFEGEGRVSTQAIREYNRVNGRIVEKKQVTSVDANKLIDQLQGVKSNDSY